MTDDWLQAPTWFGESFQDNHPSIIINNHDACLEKERVRRESALVVVLKGGKRERVGITINNHDAYMERAGVLYCNGGGSDRVY